MNDSDTRDALTKKVTALYETAPDNPRPDVDFIVRAVQLREVWESRGSVRNSQELAGLAFVGLESRYAHELDNDREIDRLQALRSLIIVLQSFTPDEIEELLGITAQWKGTHERKYDRD